MIGKPNYNIRGSQPSGTPARSKPPTGTRSMSDKEISHLNRLQRQNVKVNTGNKKANEQQIVEEDLQTNALSRIQNLLSKQHETFMKMNKALNAYKPYLKAAADASPQLKLQTKLLQQSFKLMVRPFGDMIANLIRPFVRMFLRLAIHMYKFYSYMNKIHNLFTPNSYRNSTEDQAEQLLIQKRHAESAGDTTTANRIEMLLQELRKKDKEGVQRAEAADLRTQVETELPYIIQEKKDGVTDQVKEWWENTKTWWEENKEKFTSPVMTTFTAVKDTLISAYNTIKEKTDAWWVFGKISLGNATTSGLSEITKAADAWFQSMKSKYGGKDESKSSGLMSSIAEKVIDTTKGFMSKMPNVVNTGVDIFKKALGFKSEKNTAEPVATGGYINSSGLYNLHAGEKVVNAGQTSREKNSLNIVNNYTIHANISSNIDIRSLANRLAELQETELRRRASY